MAGSELRTQKKAVNPQAGRIWAGISWACFGESLSSPLFCRIWEGFQESPPAVPSKIHGKILRKVRPIKSAKKYAKKSTRKSARKSAEKSARKFQRKIRHKIRHGNTHLPAVVIAQALQKVCATSLACSGFSTGTKQALSDAKFSGKSAKNNSPRPSVDLIFSTGSCTGIPRQQAHVRKSSPPENARKVDFSESRLLQRPELSHC